MAPSCSSRQSAGRSLKLTTPSLGHQHDAVQRLNHYATGTNTGTSTDDSNEVEEPVAKLTGLAGKNGGPCRDRTYDPLIKSQLLYQLS